MISHRPPDETGGGSASPMLSQPFRITAPAASQEFVPAHLRSCPDGQSVRHVECVRVNKAGQEPKGPFTVQLLKEERGQPDTVCMLANDPAP